SSASSASTASSASDDPKGREVLGQFASPYLSNHFTARLACGCGSHGHVTRSPATLNVQRVRWAKLAPSCLVWLATWPSPEIQLTHYPLTAAAGACGTPPARGWGRRIARSRPDRPGPGPPRSRVSPARRS